MRGVKRTACQTVVFSSPLQFLRYVWRRHGTRAVRCLRFMIPRCHPHPWSTTHRFQVHRSAKQIPCLTNIQHGTSPSFSFHALDCVLGLSVKPRTPLTFSTLVRCPPWRTPTSGSKLGIISISTSCILLFCGVSNGNAKGAQGHES